MEAFKEIAAALDRIAAALEELATQAKAPAPPAKPEPEVANPLAVTIGGKNFRSLEGLKGFAKDNEYKTALPTRGLACLGKCSYAR